MEEARPNITCNEPLFHLQVIQLAKELCRADTAAAAQQPQPSKHEGGQLVPALDARGTASPAPVPTAAPGTFSSLLPPQVAEQIRLAQQRAALSGQGLPAWAVGAKCRAVYSGDGNWWVALALREGTSGSDSFACILLCVVLLLHSLLLLSTPFFVFPGLLVGMTLWWKL